MKQSQVAQVADCVVTMVSKLASNQEFAKTIAGDSTLLKRLACDDALANRISLRLRGTVLKNAFLQDLTNAILKTKSHHFKYVVVDACQDFLERKRILMRLERVEEKIDTFNRELNSLVRLVRRWFRRSD